MKQKELWIAPVMALATVWNNQATVTEIPGFAMPVFDVDFANAASPEAAVGFAKSIRKTGAHACVMGGQPDRQVRVFIADVYADPSQIEAVIPEALELAGTNA
jgi:hypothetical protein